jgi:LPS-assembly protein
LAALEGVAAATPECTLNGRADVVAQLQLTAYRHWSADYGLQWDPQLERVVREYANLQYKRNGTSVVNLSYRYELNSVEQVEASAAWPVSRNWNLFLREIYSLRTETVLVVPGPNQAPIPGRIPPKPLETFGGIEYRSCCWGVRLGGRKFVSTFNSTTVSSHDSTGVFLELELMGFASVGSASDTVMMENIRGYVPPNARVPQNFVPPAFP